LSKRPDPGPALVTKNPRFDSAHPAAPQQHQQEQEEYMYTDPDDLPPPPPPPPNVTNPPGPPPERLIIYSKADVGFSPMRHERLNPVMKADAKETFDYALETEPNGKTHLGSNPMPAIAGFAQTSTKYVEQNVAVARKALALIVAGLGLKEDVFEAYFYAPLAIQRLIRYPRQNFAEKDTIGAGAHVDFGAITVLKQDSDG
jgi:hypothetical protein